MITKPDRTSPWGQRVWFTDEEFDAIMDELRERGGVAACSDGTGVDVELLLERVYGISPDFCALPAGIMGRTRFFPDGRVEVHIAPELADAENTVTRRRLRSTVAHELAHIAFHQHLHVLPPMASLFPELQRDEPRFLCRAPALGGAERSSEWWEYQANRGMASLLLPKALLASVLRQLGHADLRRALATGRGQDVVRSLMDNFDVSMEMMVYRLQDLGYLPRQGQAELSFGS